MDTRNNNNKARNKNGLFSSQASRSDTFPGARNLSQPKNSSESPSPLNSSGPNTPVNNPHAPTYVGSASPVRRTQDGSPLATPNLRRQNNHYRNPITRSLDLDLQRHQRNVIPTSTFSLSEINISNSKSEETGDYENENLKLSRPKFRGPMTPYYIPFYDYFVDVRTTLGNKFSTFGAVANTAELFFADTPQCRKNANNLLAGFWSLAKNVELTVNAHAKKFEETTKQEQFPACISFVDVTIQGKNYCLVAISGVCNPELNNALEQYISLFNKNRTEQMPEYLLIKDEYSDFQKFVKPFYDLNKESPCAEYVYCAFILKNIIEGKRVFVTGVENCPFYPYERGLNYGSQENSKDPKVRPPLFTNPNFALDLASLSMRIPLIPCCENCKQRKMTILSVLKAGEKFARDFANLVKEKAAHVADLASKSKPSAKPGGFNPRATGNFTRTTQQRDSMQPSSTTTEKKFYR